MPSFPHERNGTRWRRIVADGSVTSSNGRRRWSTIAIALSAMLHGATCFGLACFVAAGGTGTGEGLGIDAGFTSEVQLSDEDLLDEMLREFAPRPAESSVAVTMTALEFESRPIDLPEIPLLDAPNAPPSTNATNSSESTTDPNRPSTEKSVPAPAAKSAGLLKFFGAEVEGDAVVFLVDASSSMTPARFRRAIVELESALRQLTPGQQFAVILFNDEVLPLFHPESEAELIEASPEIRRRASTWLRKQRPDALTNPLPALEAALALGPQSIVLLTDGELPATVLAPVRDANRAHPRIHVLSFDAEEGARVLKTLAAATGGTFRIAE